MNCIQQNNSCYVVGNKVWIDGTLLPPVPSKGLRSVVVNNKVYIDGYEFVNGRWKRTLKALWHMLF